MEPKDCNGNLISVGDTIQPVKDLKVKKSSMTIKRGTAIKVSGIDSDTVVWGKVNGQKLGLETQYFKKR